MKQHLGERIGGHLSGPVAHGCGGYVAGRGRTLVYGVEPYDGCIAVCYVDGEFTVKRVKLEAAGAWLLPSNPAYPPIRVDADNEFSIWGVVRHVVKTFK